MICNERVRGQVKLGLAHPLSPLARRPFLGARHYPLRATPHPIAGREVAGGMRAEPRPSPRRRNDALSAYWPRPSQRTAQLARGHDLGAIGGGRGGRGGRGNAHAQAAVRTSRSRPHGGSLASLRSRRSFLLPVLIEPGVFGRLGGAQYPPRSGSWRSPARSPPRSPASSRPRRPRPTPPLPDSVHSPLTAEVANARPFQ